MPTPGRRRIITAVSAAAAISAAAVVLALIHLPSQGRPSPVPVMPTANAPIAHTTETAELTRLAQNHLQQRADMLTTAAPTVGAASKRLRTTRPMADRVQGELAALKKRGETYREADGGYTKARAGVDVTAMDVTDRTATLHLTENTSLYYAFTPQEIEDGAPEYEGLALPHTMTFTRGPDGAWLLSSDTTDTQHGLLATTQVTDEEIADAVADSGSKPR